MSEMSIKEALMTLTKLEATILKKKCDGLKYEKIGQILNYSEVTITLYMSNVYTKLGIDKSLHWTKRVEILRETYCPALDDILQGREVEDIDWPIKEEEKPNPELLPVIIEDEVMELARIEDKERTKPLPPLPQPTTKIDIPKEGETPRPFPWLATAITILCIGGVVVVTILYRLVGQLNLISLVSTPTNEVLMLKTSTPKPTLDILKTWEAATIRAQQLNFVKPTSTPGPTSTSLPTLAPTDTPVPIKLPFTDNFTKSYDSRWSIFAGEPAISNGRLVDNSNNSTLMSIGNSGWSNYVVNVSEVAIDSDAVISNVAWDFYIGVRMQDLNNFIALKYTGVGYWYIVENGKWTQIPNTTIFGGTLDPYNLDFVLTVKGNEFTARISNGKTSYFVLPDKYTSRFKNGGVLLNVDHILGLDSVRISTAP